MIPARQSDSLRGLRVVPRLDEDERLDERWTQQKAVTPGKARSLAGPAPWVGAQRGERGLPRRGVLFFSGMATSGGAVSDRREVRKVRYWYVAAQLQKETGGGLKALAWRALITRKGRLTLEMRQRAT